MNEYKREALILKKHQNNKETTNENQREKLHFQYVSLFLSVVAIVISLLNGVDNYTLQKPKMILDDTRCQVQIKQTDSNT